MNLLWRGHAVAGVLAATFVADENATVGQVLDVPLRRRHRALADRRPFARGEVAFEAIEVAIEDSPLSAEALGGLIGLIADNTISGRIAKDVFEEMLASGKEAAAIVEEKGLRQVTDTGAIEKAIDAILAANADKVAEYKSGKDKLFGFFVGQVMKATGGKANPAMLNELLKKKLS